ncbi:ATP-binding protein [Novosphingobium sp. 9]|uniref:ATP-binding protein n=1 Tax=Novosphingobium sp. 9 TaxID=2025349 RepID=UPI0021B5E5D8|nr:ATP-binding protein [Novosphingobium sp. 9]
MKSPSTTRLKGLPLAVQMIAMLVCALIAAQLVTLALTVMLPPSPTARWSIDEVVDALTNRQLADRLERKTMAGPPDVSGEGWLVSESSRDVLAKRLGVDRRNVVLAFYTQLPVGGVAVPAKARSPLSDFADNAPTGPAIPHWLGLSSLLIEVAHAQSIPGGPPSIGQSASPMRFPGGQFPGGRLPGGRLPGGGMPGGRFPGGHLPGNHLPGGSVTPGGQPTGTRNPDGTMPSRTPGNGFTGTSPESTLVTGSSSVTDRGYQQIPNFGQNPASALIGNGIGGEVGTQGMGPAHTPGFVSAPLNAARPAGLSGPLVIDSPVAKAADRADDSADMIRRPTVRTPIAMASSVPSQTAGLIDDLNPVSVERSAALARQAAFDATVAGTPQPIPFRRSNESLFAFASPPFIEGDFIAAARQPDGRWIAVAPRAEPFPNAWQKRVMLWFALSLLITSPLAWMFVRRIVLPLREFARAAEQLGRDPSATILPLSGPAEIGRAANAFNQMRNRVRSFVDDRTAMVGAISHDLRTPLTRLRFRIEDVPDEQREGLLREVTEMEAMISQVIAFIRDASTPGPRERFDFADLISRSVDDAQLVGGDVKLERNAHIPVDVDPVGIRRLIGNLLENAIKYGATPVRVRASLRNGEAVVEIIDNGTGIPEEEFDHAFEPFYRSEAARKSGQKGTGLGLAVCRSIARAHGGDVTFQHTSDGFVARLSLPASYEQTRRRPAEPVLRKAA